MPRSNRPFQKLPVLTHWAFHTAVFVSRGFMVTSLAESLKFYTDYIEPEVSSLTPL